LYVGSAIRSKGPLGSENIVGVVSVSKATESFNSFVAGGQDRIILMVVTILVGAIALAMLLSYWLTRPINGLIKYAQTVARGENARPPKTSFRDFEKLGTEFERMRVALEKKESVKSYVNDVTHALKSPLTAIKATAELLENEVPHDNKGLFVNIEAEADRANKLLNDLLRIAQLEARVGLNKNEKLSIKELIEETLRSLEPIIKKKKIIIEVKWSSSKPIVRGERFLILQVFENIILNAIEFSPIEGKIIIESVTDKKTDQIFVRDQGPGIPEYAKEKIFNKFYSLERPSGKKSTGLGLSFVMEALSFHNGMIELEPSSHEMSGANFKVSFFKG
jgi:two-component system sensor histidine kinase CreC